MSWKLEFTMHIRGELNNPYTLNARLYYPDGPSNEPFIFSFDVEPPHKPPRSLILQLIDNLSNAIKFPSLTRQFERSIT